jgi:hypothetical protein
VNTEELFAAVVFITALLSLLVALGVWLLG